MTQNIDLKSLQNELLAMMKDIDAICREQGVEYSLTGGSLLGAIRESGFIPWDDDMDIMVDRRNYARLCAAIRGCDKYEMGRGPWLQHIKPVSFDSDIDPYIDVFIMDNLPDDRLRAALKILLLRLLQGMLKEQVEYKGFSGFYKTCIFITHAIGKLFTRRFKLRLYDSVSQIGDSSPSSYISITNDSFNLLTKKHRAELMKEYEDHRFEDTELRVTKLADSYLTVRYGSDYMTPPEESERIPAQHRYRPKVKDERLEIG